ncbi:MAG: hypothetical protein LLF76_12180 [Planctomycetaceae bacterium]|nr:hypothetical protein [Planctomycetaceae bacterium]
MLKKMIPSVILLACFVGRIDAVAADTSIDLSGTWEFQLGPSAAEKTMTLSMSSQKMPEVYNDTIMLPGTTDTNQKGIKTVGGSKGTYTRRYKHIGLAWYRRTINIPNEWKSRNTELFIERALWKTTVYVDGNKQGEYDSLAAPHVYNLGIIEPGLHTLTICVDNSMIYNIGDKSHSYTENMQTIWNGMIGRLELRCQNGITIKAVRSRLGANDSEADQLLVTTDNRALAPKECSISLELTDSAGEKKRSINKCTLQPGVQNINCPLPPNIVRWDEFNPHLYDAQVIVQAEREKTIWQGKLGFCHPGHDGTYITINGRPTFLRGNLDNCHFPLTGYPPMDKAAWLRVWNIYRQFGLNHVRFHSWCPPEAAFAAADEVGIYLQVEAGVWIDGWMKRRVASSPQGISDNNIPVRDFVEREMKRIVDAYGHHPSFIMFCIGNELGSSDFKSLAKLVKHTSQYDNTSRLYSCSTARVLQAEVDGFFVSHENSAGDMRGLHGSRTDWTYDDVKKGAPNTPLILHELGQWPIWPRWSEIEKYTGVVEARNLKQFKALAQENHLARDAEFQSASGRFSVLLYKAEIEAALRTRTYSGFHMLGLQDYMGQGEALIGILDMFYDLKPGIINSEEYRQFCSPVVPLAEFERYTWASGEAFSAILKISNFSPTAINRPISWKLCSQNGETLGQGSIDKEVLQGTVTDVGQVSVKLNTAVPLACRLEVAIDQTPYKNTWPIWVYPARTKVNVPQTVLISQGFDDRTIQALDLGESVLLIAADCMNEDNSQKNNFMPVYWSLGWFPGQNATLGLTCDPQHPLFRLFPNNGYCDWQWYDIVNDSPAMIINELPNDYSPIVEPIDDFHLARRLAAVFETKVGRGKLLVCVYPLLDRLDSSACRQFYDALLTYAASDEFQPPIELPLDWLKRNLAPQAKAPTADEKAFGSLDAALWVQVAEKAERLGKTIPYSAELDVTMSQKDGYGYQLTGEGAWNDAGAKVLFGKSIKLEITLPTGVEGTVYVKFNDRNQNNRKGRIVFENRSFVLGEHAEKEGRWLQFDVMREDTLDNTLTLQADTTSGPNLQIDELIFVSAKK